MAENALIIIARSPESGEVKTRLKKILSDEERVALYTRLLDGTVGRMKGISGAETFITYTPANAAGYFERFNVKIFPQGDGDLGARLSGAIEHVYALGYDRIAIVGSDVPGLSSRIGSEAFKSLSDADITIGPSTDGGYYLIGMSRPIPELFEDIPWSTNMVLKTTVKKARELGLTIELLDILDDVDTPEDLERLGLMPNS